MVRHGACRVPGTAPAVHPLTAAPRGGTSCGQGGHQRWQLHSVIVPLAETAAAFATASAAAVKYYWIVCIFVGGAPENRTLLGHAEFRLTTDR